MPALAMKIVWHGHSCFEINEGGMTVTIDPHDGKSLGINAPTVSANAVLMTHDHYDHNAVRAVNGIHKDFMAVDGAFSYGHFIFEGFPSYHDDSLGSKRGKNTLYKITGRKITLCHCGDMGCILSDDIISKIKGVDILFVPVGEVYTLKVEEIAEMIRAVRPKVVVPMHYRVRGLSVPLTSPDKILDILSDMPVTHVGAEIDFSDDELPSETEIWMFSR